MWYETIPFFAVMFGAAFATNYVAPPVNYAFTGRFCSNRMPYNKLDKEWVDRDEKMFKTRYASKGLENL